MTLPKDLKLFCLKRILKRVIPCIILVAAFATILALWGNVIFKTDNKTFQTSCYIVSMFLPFVITGVPHKLIDSTYYGIVKKVDIVTTTASSSSIRPSTETLYLKNTIYLKVERPDGKLVYKKVYSGKARFQQNINTYNEGDLVFHLYGTNTVVVLPDTNDSSVHCSVCGTSNSIENNKCCDCGHSVVKRI